MPLETPFDATSDNPYRFHTVPSPASQCVSNPQQAHKNNISPSVLLYGTWVAKYSDLLMINKSFYSNIMDEFITE